MLNGKANQEKCDFEDCHMKDVGLDATKPSLPQVFTIGIASKLRKEPTTPVFLFEQAMD